MFSCFFFFSREVPQLFEIIFCFSMGFYDCLDFFRGFVGFKPTVDLLGESLHLYL